MVDKHCIRIVNGFLLIDKPSGVSSATILHRIQVLFQAKKIGHTGTLDPLATGMLPICFGEATKFSKYLLQADKLYRVIVRLGERTNTFDSYGDIVDVRPVKLVNSICLQNVLNNFIGLRYQTPPMFSALKYKGCPLYKYARQGIDIPRIPRLINVYKIKLIQWHGNSNIELEVFCSKGTYIRTLIDDFGERLGCGAHVVSLRRLSVGQFTSSYMVSVCFLYQYIHGITNNIDYFKKLDLLLKPVDVIVNHLPEINVSLKICQLLQFGQKLFLDTTIYKDVFHVGLVRMTVGHARTFFGVGTITNDRYLLAHRLISFG